MEVVRFKYSLLDCDFLFVSFFLLYNWIAIYFHLFFLIVNDYYQNNITSQGFELSRESRAQADLKYTYVVSCQIYGQQKQRKAPEAADISLLLQKYEICDLVSVLLLNFFLKLV